MVDSLDPSELVTRITLSSLEKHDLDVILFFERIARAATPHLCSNMHSYEAYGFNGPTIATNLKTAFKLIRFPSPKPKFFFVNDLEWLHMDVKNYEILEPIYRNNELSIIARSNDHAKLIENCWNIKVDHVVENYDFFTDSFLGYLKGKIDGAVKYINYPVKYKNVLDYL